ncbi:MFS transporter [Trueperella pecoris]|uniref:MFS transporter n=1 Tax=Trueperella pecoris TaxID=2733571 RepID=A0A7M1R0E5_9ACTO|nr:MFS transporter [Trueperella pecoris]QOR47658.1 MFS transporter [Trueperella pecoris]
MRTSALWQMEDYRWWFSAKALDESGNSIRQLALTLVAYAISGSATIAGLVGTVSLVMRFALALPGGLAVDRFDRRRLMQIKAGCSVLIWATFIALLATQTLTVALLLAIVSALSLLSGLTGGASDALLRSIVPKDQYAQARAINEGREAAIELGGPPLGGFLYSVASFLPFVVSLLGNLGMLIVTSKIKSSPAPAPRQEDTLLRRIAGGFTAVLGPINFRVIMLVVLIANIGFLLVQSGVTIALVAEGMNPVQVGLLGTAAASGVLLGAMWTPSMLSTIPTGQLVSGCFIAMTLCVIPMALTSNLIILAASMFASVMFAPAISAGLDGFIFSSLDEWVQGRAASVVQLIIGGPCALCPLLAGLIIENSGRAMLVLACVAIMALASLIAIVAKSVRTIPLPTQW